MTYVHALFEAAIAELRRDHHASVGGNVWWSWSCSCGRSGTPTTQGRAAAGKDRHLGAERRKIYLRMQARLTEIDDEIEDLHRAREASVGAVEYAEHHNRIAALRAERAALTQPAPRSTP